MSHIHCLQVAITAPEGGSWGRSILRYLLTITHPGKVGHTTGSASPTLFEQRRGFFYVPQEPDKWNCCEIGPTVFRPYWRRLESLTICRCHYKDIKTALSSQLFNDPDCWSRRALNPWPTSQQTSTLPTELPRRRCCIWKLEFKPCCALFPQKRNFPSLSIFTCRCMNGCCRCTVIWEGLSSRWAPCWICDLSR